MRPGERDEAVPGRAFRLANARVVLPAELRETDILVRDGLIDLEPRGEFAGETIDLEGDFLLPGLIELHTDNLERHIEPRPGTFVPLPLAVRAHDAELAGAGITTAFNALTLGGGEREEARSVPLGVVLRTLARAMDAGALRCSHLFHLRCELSDEAFHHHLEDLDPPLKPAIVSLMDHTPGQGQFTDLGQFRRYYTRRYALDPDAVEALIARRRNARAVHGARNRDAAIAFARAASALLVTHDDRTGEDIVFAKKSGAHMVEFPTTAFAAREAKRSGLKVLAGAPNLLRGASLSGNVAAADLMQSGNLDILSSDYYPASLLAGLFKLARDFAVPLPRAVATATSVPAALLGLKDRGEIETGRRADLVRVRETPIGPVVMAVWQSGARVW
jgi:alpha-D-ribose 1-methylphosphonate 5-triphosphate diphosphatase